MREQTISFERRVAYHEAGHAVAASILGFHIIEVSIGDDGKFQGYCAVMPPDPTPGGLSIGEYEAAIIRKHAGMRALFQVSADPQDLVSEAARLDAEAARQMANDARNQFEALAGHADLTAWYDALLNRTVTLVEEYWQAISAIAEMLLERRRMDGQEVQATIAATKQNGNSASRPAA